MRFYSIAIYLLIFQMVSFYVTSELLPGMGITSGISFHDTTMTAEEIANMETRYSTSLGETEITNQDPVSVFLASASRETLSAVSAVLNPMKQFVYTLPYMLIVLGVPEGFAYITGVAYWMIMLDGIVEFTTGRKILSE